MKTFTFGKLGIILVIIIVPWLYGGVTTFSWLFCSFTISLIFLILTIFWLGSAFKPGVRSQWLPRLTGLEIILLLMVLYPFCQLIPLPQSLVQKISPMRVHLEDISQTAETYPVVETFDTYFFDNTKGETTSGPGLIPLSISPYRTFCVAVHGIILLMWYFLILVCFRRVSAIRFLFGVIALIGLSQAGYGLIEFLSGHQHVLSYYEQGRKFVSGSFINRNHCAAFLGMSFFTSVGLVLHSINRIDTTKLISWRKKVSLVFSERNALLFFWMLCAVLIGFGILYTKSRSGIFCVVMGMVLLFFIHYQKQSTWKSLVFFFVILIMTFIVTGLVGIGERFEILYENNHNNIGRVDMWHETLAIWKDFSLTGSGFNTFVRIHPRYKQKANMSFLEHAHNDYLELLSEGGVIAFFFVILFGVIVFKRFFDRLNKLSHQDFPLFSGAFVGIVVFSLHEFTDFSGHILANQLLFIILLTLVPAKEINSMTPDSARRTLDPTQNNLNKIGGLTEENNRIYQKPEILN